MYQPPTLSFEPYATKFFGFGRWDAFIWFVGTEEAGAPTLEELGRRIRVWTERGQRELEDAPSFYPAAGQRDWHGGTARPQPTWQQLIRILLLARGSQNSKECLLDYQRRKLGASSGEVCLTELSPMPAPTHLQWPYEGWQAVPEWLRSRESFTTRYRPARLNVIKQKIAEHGPRAVIFYFWKPKECAETIAGEAFQPLIPQKLLGRQHTSTHFFVIGHPTRYGAPYVQEVGNFFHEHHAPLFVPPPA